MARAALADAERLASAYRDHRRDLVGFARRRLGSAELAEDAVQETFVRACRSIGRFDPTLGSTRMWLFAICRNASVDLAHHRARQARGDLLAAVHASADESGLEVELVHQIAARGVTERALRSMSGPQRDAVTQVHLRDRPYAAVADEFGVAVGTLKSRVHGALQAARRAA